MARIGRHTPTIIPLQLTDGPIVAEPVIALDVPHKFDLSSGWKLISYLAYLLIIKAGSSEPCVEVDDGR